MERDIVKLFKCLADKTRLLIINNLEKEPMYVELLSERLGLAPSTISFHLKKLEESGLVHSVKEQYYVMYHLNNEMLSLSLSSLINQTENEKDMQTLREEQYKQKVIDTFFEYGKLKSIPVQRKKRDIVLREIAKVFEPGKRYTEKEVNIAIADFHDDFCTIRREFICSGIMKRDKNMYWLVEE